MDLKRVLLEIKSFKKFKNKSNIYVHILQQNENIFLLIILTLKVIEAGQLFFIYFYWCIYNIWLVSGIQHNSYL